MQHLFKKNISLQKKVLYRFLRRKIATPNSRAANCSWSRLELLSVPVECPHQICHCVLFLLLQRKSRKTLCIIILILVVGIVIICLIIWGLRGWIGKEWTAAWRRLGYGDRFSWSLSTLLRLWCKGWLHTMSFLLGEGGSFGFNLIISNTEGFSKYHYWYSTHAF